MKKKEQTINRLPLRGWAVLDDKQRSIKKAAEEGNYSAIPFYIFEIIELCVEGFDRNSFWMDVAELYNKVQLTNQPTKNFPILTSKEKGKEMPWEYEGRSWYFWLNLFAKTYGWDEEKIGSMDIDDAIGLYQETQIDEQLRQEWEWGLSELSYEYNKSTRKSHFKPLPRPSWMKPIAPARTVIKKTKIPAAMMPQGQIVFLDETPTSENKPE